MRPNGLPPASSQRKNSTVRAIGLPDRTSTAASVLLEERTYADVRFSLELRIRLRLAIRSRVVECAMDCLVAHARSIFNEFMWVYGPFLKQFDEYLVP